MTPTEQLPSPTPTITDSTVTEPPLPGNASLQTEPMSLEVPLRQRRTKDVGKVVGYESLPPHLLDHGDATKDMPKTFVFGIHCSTEQLEAAVINAQLMTEEEVAAVEADMDIYEATENHMIKLFKSPFIEAKVAYSKEGQRKGAVLVSLYSNHEVTKATKRMEKNGVTIEAMVKWIQQYLQVDEKDSPARWYEPVVGGTNHG